MSALPLPTTLNEEKAACNLPWATAWRPICSAARADVSKYEQQ